MSIEQAHHLVAVRRWAEAKEALAEPLADPGAGCAPWCLLAQCELGLVQPQRAKEAAQRALTIDPQRLWAMRLLAVSQEALGQLAQAQQTAERGMALDPESPEMAHILILILLARRKHTAAEALATRNLEFNGTGALAWESAANVSLRRSRWAECESRARRALAIEPDDTAVMMMLGVALQAQGRRTEAGELYARVTRLDPSDNRGREALGELGLRVSNSRAPNALRYLLLMVPHLWPGLLIGRTVQSYKQWRARAGLSPQVRAVARREQRAAAGTRLFVIGVIGIAMAGIWASAQQWPWAAGAGAAGIGSLAMWRWWAPAQGRRWVQALRGRLNRVRR